MKKLVAIILAGLMLLSLAACGGKKDDVVKVGVLEASGMEDVYTSEHMEHIKEERGDASSTTVEMISYNNLSAALMDLESGKINSIALEECTAQYIAAHNDKITVAEKNTARITDYSMMTMDSNKEVYDILNNAIKDMKADGTLDSLIANELKAYINSDPEAKDLPHFDGAVTIKIGVTGDMPPMDFITSNGKAAGFNIALLAEIANRAKVNFELVQIEAGSRPMALSSGKVDVVFWIASVTCTKCNETTTEKTDGTLVTESYYSDSNAFVKLKSEK